MKRRDWKKTAAFVTSVAMAASMMPAELGGVLVHAIDSAIVSEEGGSALTASTLQVGDYFENDALLNVPTGGKVKINYDVITSTGSSGPQTTHTYTFPVENVSAVKYEAAHQDTKEENGVEVPDGKPYGRLTITDAGNTENWINLKDLMEGKFICVKSVNTNDGLTTIDLELKDVVDKYNINWAEARKVIKNIKYTSDDGVANNLSGSVVSSTNGADVKAKTQVTITSSVILEAGEKDLTPYMTGEPGNYVYTFNALDALVIKPVASDLKLEDAEGTGGSIESINGTAPSITETPSGSSNIIKSINLKVGSEVTIVSDTKFKIKNGAVKSVQKSDTGIFETEDVVSTYANGKWSAKFYYSGAEKLEYVKHNHDLRYDLETKVNELYASCSDKDLNQETAAKVWTEIANGSAEPTEIANNGTVSYDSDASINFKWDANLLGTSGENAAQELDKKLVARATLKKGDVEYLYRVYEEETYEGRKCNKVKITVKAKNASGTVVETSIAEDMLNAEDKKTLSIDGIDNVVEITGKSIKINKEFAALAGTYEASLTVWGTKVEDAAKVLTYKYVTAPSDQIKESDVKVYAAYTGTLSEGYAENPKTIADYVKCVEVKKDAFEVNVNENTKKEYLKAIDDLHVAVKANALDCRKNDNGIWEIPTDAETLANKHTVTAVFEVENSKNIALNVDIANPGEKLPVLFDQDFDFTLSGSSFSSTIDPSTPQTMNVSIKNPNYKAETFKTQWKLVTPKVEDGIYFEGALASATTAKEIKVTGFAENVKSLLNKKGDNDIDLANAEYWYTTNPPTDNYDIDDIVYGLPNPEAEDVGKEYYIYASVGDFITPNSLRVKVASDDNNAVAKQSVVAKLNKSTFTYGDKIEAKDLYFTANGTTVSNAVATGEIGFDVYPYNKLNGKYSDSALNGGGSVNINKLAPGQYLLKPKNVTFANTTAYEVDGTTGIEITINKKKLSTDMVDVIIKEIGNASSLSVTNADVTAAANGRGVGAYENIDLKLTGGGFNTADKVGTYSVEVRASDAYIPLGLIGTQQGSVKYSDVYDGNLDVSWYVIKDRSETAFSLEVDKSKANIYKDDTYGVQIHIEADMKIGGNVATAANKKATVKYGFVYDKSGKFALGATTEEVNKSLRLDNGFSSTNGVIKNTDGVVTGLNSIVKSVDDYIWVRPYATVEGGAPVYGDAVCYNFREAAQDSVKPEIKEVSFVQKNGTPYYYVYATKADRVDTDNKRTAEPDKWGVAISREGNYGAVTDFDYEKLTLDNCDVSSFAVKNQNYNTYEVGTLVRITDSRSRVYVRTYADYGNGLVVYSELPVKDSENHNLDTIEAKLNAVSQESASTKLAAYLGLGTAIQTIENRTVMAVLRAKDPAATIANPSRTTKAGKVQKFEAFDLSGEYITDTGLVIDNKGLYNAAVHKLILGEAGFTNAHKTGILTSDQGTNISNDTIDFCAVTSKKEVTIRGYVLYKGIRVYTEIKTNIVPAAPNP